jgi:predicted PhzF superfamily epimerase YddE/YHI9
VAPRSSVFAAYLSAQSGLRSATHPFIQERGFDATRKSLLQAEFDKRDHGGLKLGVGGHAVQVIQGVLSVRD